VSFLIPLYTSQQAHLSALSGSNDNKASLLAAGSHFAPEQKHQMAPRLPPEVVLDILEEADSSTLRSTARIGSSWRVPSQFLLHRNLSLLTSTSLKAYQGASSTRRDFAARKLHLLMGTPGEEGVQVLAKAHGVRELLLKSERRKMKAEVLEQKSLAGE
jgi:hypothetical protein